MTALALTVKDAEETLEQVRSLPLASEADAALLNEVFVAAYTGANALEKEMKEKTAPKRQEIKKGEADYRAAIDALRKVEAAIRTRVEVTALEALERKGKALADAVQEARGGLTFLSEEAPPIALPGGLTVSFDWAFELTGEPVEEEFLSPDAGKISAFLKDYKNSEYVPPRAGVRWKRTCATRAKAVK
jgi:hypothetical protein